MSALADALRAHGGTIAETLVGEPAPSIAGPAQIAARGPRAAGSESEYELLVEMILEGSRLHYGSPCTVRTDDPDLALLLGDQLYALGLVRLAALGDLDAVAELADDPVMGNPAVTDERAIVAERPRRRGALVRVRLL